MDNIKLKDKLLCLFLSILLLSLTVVVVPTKALGAGQHYITVNNAVNSQTYSAYQVFYKVGNDYMINSSSPFFDKIVEYNINQTDLNKKIAIQEMGSTTEGSNTEYKVMVSSSFLDNEAKTLASYFESIDNWQDSSYKKATAVPSNNTCKLGPLDNGYYAIKTTFGPKIGLVSILDFDVTVNEKNTESDIGELSFNIVRDAYGYEDWAETTTKFRFTNATQYDLSNSHDFIIGNTYWYKADNNKNIAIFRNFKDNVKVYYAEDTDGTYQPSDTDTPLVAGTNYKFETSDPIWANWKITFDQNLKPNNFGKQNYSIYVKVQGIVWNDLNVADNDGKSAAYEYSNKGSGIDHKALAKMQTKEGGVIKDKLVKNDSFRVLGTSLIKVASGDDTGAVLEGAKFKVYFKNDVNGDALRWTTSTSADGKKVYTVTSGSGGSEEIEVGAADLVGLGDGNYYLSEVEAPEGYNKATDTIKLTPGVKIGDGNDSVWASSFNKTISKDAETDKPVYDPTTKGKAQSGKVVENSKGLIIPGTGGIGTIIFIVAGFILICTGVVCCATRRKLHNQASIINK